MIDPVVQLQWYFWVSDAKDETIASLTFRRRHGVLWASNLWVHADHRRKGLATRLLRAGVAELGAEPIYGFVSAYGELSPNDAQLIDFYGRFGFKPTATPGVLLRPAGHKPRGD